MDKEMGPAQEMATLLAAILPEMGPGETVEGRYLLAGAPAQTRFYSTPVALVADVLGQWRAARHCYVGVALRQGNRGTAADVSRAGCCWADVDHKLWAGLDDPEAAALTAVSEFRPIPSVVVHSGGGLQPYWLLDAPYDVRAEGRERLERLNATLARAVCGQGRTPDHVQDCPRIFRLPGTLNHKYTPAREATLLWCDTGRRYSISGLEQTLGVRYPWAVRPEAATQPQGSAPDYARVTAPLGLRDRAAAGRIKGTTLALLDDTGAAGYQSASEADAALAAGLIGAGLTAAECYALLLTSQRGRDALRRKGERHGEYYLRRTVHRAAGFVGPVGTMRENSITEIVSRRLAASPHTY